MNDALFTEPLAVPLAAQIACVEREIVMREKVYARRVEQHYMTQKTADQELAAMRAVLVTLKGLA